MTGTGNSISLSLILNSIGLTDVIQAPQLGYGIFQEQPEDPVDVLLLHGHTYFVCSNEVAALPKCVQCGAEWFQADHF